MWKQTFCVLIILLALNAYCKVKEVKNQKPKPYVCKLVPKKVKVRSLARVDFLARRDVVKVVTGALDKADQILGKLKQAQSFIQAAAANTQEIATVIKFFGPVAVSDQKFILINNK